MTDEAGESREVGGGGEDFQANCVGMVRWIFFHDNPEKDG